MAAAESLAPILSLLSFSCGYCVVHSLLTYGQLPQARSVDHHICSCTSISPHERPLVRQLITHIRHHWRTRACYTCHLPSIVHVPAYGRWFQSGVDHPHAHLVPQALWAIRFLDGHVYRQAMHALSVHSSGHSWDTPEQLALWISDPQATQDGNSAIALVRFLQTEFNLSP
ncbi:hypothetical protein BD626DRAFT_420033 [Schizophyllum amplum]|uniref:Uncharacterized protein n=1 Tax=Schizophyllum amplum TaxID=97359 RepID=A0A550BRN7_9AGAR|nr:hypothetical protein BD626DRAFT_420033 [Auriculariopsis ampla]